MRGPWPTYPDGRVNGGLRGARVKRAFATAPTLAILLLSACGDKPMAVVTSVDTFCTRVERFHATEAERAALKADSGPLERVIRWVAGINKQYDDHCLQPAKGA